MAKLAYAAWRIVDALLPGPAPPRGYQPTGDAMPGLPPRGAAGPSSANSRTHSRVDPVEAPDA